MSEKTFEHNAKAYALLMAYLEKRNWDGITDNRMHTFLAEHKVVVLVQPSKNIDDLTYVIDDRESKKRFSLRTGVQSYREAYEMAFKKAMEMLEERLNVK